MFGLVCHCFTWGWVLVMEHGVGVEPTIEGFADPCLAD